MSNRNGAVRFFGGGINSAAYWVGTTLLSASHVLNDSSVTGTTVKDALNYLSTSSTAVFPFVASGLAEQDLVSYDASAATWTNRTKANALKGTGTGSIVVGSGSFAAGLDDITFGTSAGSSSNAGDGNIAIGRDALDEATESVINLIAIGVAALSGPLTNTARGSVAIGAEALKLLSSGDRNVAIGQQTLATITTGAANTAVGYRSITSAAGGVGYCVAVGAQTLYSAVGVAASGAVAIGYAALENLTTGDRNTAIGYLSQRSITIGASNTSLGYLTLNQANSDVSNCVVVGSAAAAAVVTAAANGCVAVGHRCFNALTTGASNTAVGYLAGTVVSTGARNSLFGWNVRSAAGADDNTFIGDEVGSTSVGSRNTAVGSQSFNSASAAVTDVAVLGYNALTGILSSTAPSGSVAIGSTALQAATTGFNSAVGFAAGLLLTIGTGNALFGANAGDTLTTGNNNTILGHNADVTANSRSGTVVIGTGASAAADDTLVIRMGNTSTKEIVVTPVVTSTPVSTVSNLPITVGGTSYTIPLGPSAYNYTDVITSDEVIAVNNTVVDSTMSVSIPAGTYSFSYMGCITHSTATGGSITLRSSTAATMTWTGRADINGTSAIAVDNNTASVTAGNTGGIIVTQSSVSKQVVHAQGIITCAAASVITVAVYDSANQNITLHAGSSIAVTRS